MNIIFSDNKLIKKIKNNLFPFYRSKEIKKLFSILKEGQPKNKKVAMFVGGCVRKYLENDEVDDIDIATVYTPEQIQDLIKDKEIRFIETGIEHGSIILIINNFKFEITTLRKDIKTDGRHAIVDYTDNWQEDSERRDFTINSIYMDQNGKIFDPQSGVKDLKNQIIKFIGDPGKRIEEDYLRIIRYIRFVLLYNSEVDSHTNELVKLNLNGIKNISKERILNELFKILLLKNFKNILKNKDIEKIFLLIFPEFKHLNRLKKINLLSKSFLLKDYLTLAIMLSDDTDNYEYFCHKYKVSKEIKNKLKFLSTFLNKYQNDKNDFQKDLEKNIYYYGKNNLKDLCTLLFFSEKKNTIKSFLQTLKNIEKISIPKFPYDGNYLKNKGFVEGKKMGSLLKILELRWIENNFSLQEKNINQIIKDN